ncbi:DUF397 domain-containing protein [Streptomyces sp. 6N223]|uniref:DUF397 domain-containing protein n=1 Tax=Streptomyces sp. 6N223 TaxID=3457412 RepID=UPI003FD4F082
MTHRIAPEAAWFKSSYSHDNGTACVEIANLRPTGRVGIRDSKNPDGPALTVPTTAFTAFLTTARST